MKVIQVMGKLIYSWAEGAMFLSPKKLESQADHYGRNQYCSLHKKTAFGESRNVVKIDNDLH